jgi:hypothetical protein
MYIKYFEIIMNDSIAFLQSSIRDSLPLFCILFEYLFYSLYLSFHFSFMSSILFLFSLISFFH